MMKKRHPRKSNVLLVNITRLGDMLQATPTIAGLKRENPDCKITVLVEKQFESVCHSIPHVDEVLSIDLSMAVRALAREKEGMVDAFEYVSDFVEDLRSRNFDYALNMSSSAYTALLLHLVGIERKGGWAADAEGYRVIESEWAQLFATSVFHQNRQYNSLNLVDVFRCSADVEEHPHQLLIDIKEDAKQRAVSLLDEMEFPADGPMVMIQAGASQLKRQWKPEKFVELIDLLTNRHRCRVLLSGTQKELSIIEPIMAQIQSDRVRSVAGKTSIDELAAFLSMSDLLITGDTGPMHMSVAVGTPVISMFLASAFGFETGPYAEGNIVLQPVIGCGPCNPNKPCSRPECHDTISPEILAELALLRLHGDCSELPPELRNYHGAIIYRTYFDEFGFYDLKPLNRGEDAEMERFRAAYRKLWLDDIGGYAFQETPRKPLPIIAGSPMEGLDMVAKTARVGQELIQELHQLILDRNATAAALGEKSEALTELDREIEQIGFHYPHLGPITRMFIFGKENISGTDAGALASQMMEVYQTLERRTDKLGRYYSQT
ncbi:MAG: glycosyltransferase family 9 protein [Bdellovibrionota bacterium]